MIPILEIKEKAREFRVPTSTIERDYTQNWLLARLGSFPLALKGGTGIRKVYIEQYRFSDDLDFTLLEQLEKDEIVHAVKETVDWVQEECGIRFDEGIGIIPTKTGYRATAKFRILSGGNTSPIKIDFDLTGIDHEEVILPVQRREVFHPYSDGLKATVTSYSLEEIMAEKIRSLFQRVRPRDIYDIWQLAERVKTEEVEAILERKCNRKGVVLNTTALQKRSDEFLAAWNNSLQHQMKIVPEFKVAFEMAVTMTDRYLQQTRQKSS
jgi:predicted nucleotidyltransferase component of viral defense system